MMKRSVKHIVVIGVAVLVCLIALGEIADFYLNHIRGNRQYTDPYQTFNVAYVLGDDSKFERVQIKFWKPVGDNRVQVVTTNDIPIYTHFSNIKLTLE